MNCATCKWWFWYDDPPSPHQPANEKPCNVDGGRGHAPIRPRDHSCGRHTERDCDTCRGTGRLWNGLLGDFIRCVDCQLAPGEM